MNLESALRKHLLDMFEINLICFTTWISYDDELKKQHLMLLHNGLYRIITGEA